MATKVVRSKEYSMDEIPDEVYMTDGQETWGEAYDAGRHIDDFNQDIYQGAEGEVTPKWDDYSQIPYPQKRK